MTKKISKSNKMAPSEEPQKQSIIVFGIIKCDGDSSLWRKFHVTKLLLAMMLTIGNTIYGRRVYSAKTTGSEKATCWDGQK